MPSSQTNPLDLARVENDDVVVTSATQTADEAAKALGVSVPTADDVETGDEQTTAAPVEAKTKKIGDEPDAIKKEADSDTPDDNVSEAARTLRRNRGDERKKQIQGDIDKLTRTKRDLEREIAAREARLAEPARVTETKPAADDPRAPKPPEPPKFVFPSWDGYQEQHPEATFEDYSDARQDARDAHRQQLADFTAAKTRAEQAVKQEATHRTETAKTFTTREETVRASHADYDEVTDKVQFDPGIHPIKAADIQDLIAESGPEVLYYLGHHPDDFSRLCESRNYPQMAKAFGAIEKSAELWFATRTGGTGSPAAASTARASETPASTSTSREEPATPKLRRPVSAAPTPGGDLPKGGAPGRSLRDLADDDDDADAYLGARYPKRMGAR